MSTKAEGNDAGLVAEAREAAARGNYSREDILALVGFVGRLSSRLESLSRPTDAEVSADCDTVRNALRAGRTYADGRSAEVLLTVMPAFHALDRIQAAIRPAPDGRRETAQQDGRRERMEQILREQAERPRLRPDAAPPAPQPHADWLGDSKRLRDGLIAVAAKALHPTASESYADEELAVRAVDALSAAFDRGRVIALIEATGSKEKGNG